MRAVQAAVAWACLLAVPAFALLPRRHVGEEVHCIRGRPHRVSFDISGHEGNGSSMEHIEDAVVTMAPDPSAGCVDTPAGWQHFCFGANNDKTCERAEESLEMTDGLECRDCFVAVQADAFYKLNYSKYHLNRLEVGLRNLKMKAGVEIFKPKDLVARISGNLPIGGDEGSHEIIDIVVGCPVCLRVDISVNVITQMLYDVQADCKGEFSAGGVMELDLGSNFVRYHEDSGWEHSFEEQQKLSVAPIFKMGKNANAKLNVKFKNTVELKLRKMAWYHFDISPNMPFTIRDIHSGWWPWRRSREVCMDGDAVFDVDQEADLNWRFLLWHKKAHWGPVPIKSWNAPGVVHTCKDVTSLEEEETGALAERSWSALFV